MSARRLRFRWTKNRSIWWLMEIVYRCHCHLMSLLPLSRELLADSFGFDFGSVWIHMSLTAGYIRHWSLFWNFFSVGTNTFTIISPDRGQSDILIPLWQVPANSCQSSLNRLLHDSSQLFFETTRQWQWYKQIEMISGQAQRQQPPWPRSWF